MTFQRRHLASSPFQPQEPPVIEEYAVGDAVCHDLYGLGRVTAAEASAVVVDFGDRAVRIVTPFVKLEKL